jgi:hypothetical protein
MAMVRAAAAHYLRYWVDYDIPYINHSGQPAAEGAGKWSENNLCTIIHGTHLLFSENTHMPIEQVQFVLSDSMNDREMVAALKAASKVFHTLLRIHLGKGMPANVPFLQILFQNAAQSETAAMTLEQVITQKSGLVSRPQ